MKENFLELRNKYPEFIYENFEVTESEQSYKVRYTFKINELEFNPIITINKRDITNKEVNKEYLYYLFFQYGLFDLASYYKLTCSERIIVKPMYLNSEQCEFFKKVLYNGLGEYFYKNSIDLSYDSFLEIVVQSDNKYIVQDFNDEFHGNLIPVGGGKDSIVSMELLRNNHDDNKLFMYERNLYPKNKAGYDSIYEAGYTDNDIVVFRNDIDLKLLELNKKGYLNGHIPISSIISMSSFIMAYLNNKKFVCLSNEASANEGNFEGLKINHQYSKSYEYEKDFYDYSIKYLNPHIYYFSLLRGLNEYQIVQYFLENKNYLPIFKSCNKGIKENRWCNHCSKCLFVYIMLYPHLTEEELMMIFDHDLLDDQSLEETFLDLLLDDRQKPFECVGTRIEINYALQESLRKKKEYPYLLKIYSEKYNKVHINSNNVIDYWNSENNIPQRYRMLFNEYQKNN